MTRRFAAALWLVACSREPRRAAEPPLFGRHADADAGSVAKECAQVESVTPIPLERPIADVMGWQGAAWLDRPDRDSTDRPDEVVRALAIQPGAAVADVGAGTGYFTFRLAAAAGDAGSVLALDVQPEMLEKLHSKLEAHGTQNVTLVQTTPHDLRLHEATLDLALMVDVYHELAEPFVALAQLRCALRPGGRLAFVEYRGEDPKVEIKPEHKLTVANLRREVEHAGYRWQRTDEFLPRQHLVVFVRP